MKCFGRFKCVCTKTWTSINSRENKPQRCGRCNRKVYPHLQEPLRETINVPEVKDDMDNMIVYLNPIIHKLMIGTLWCVAAGLVINALK